MTTSSDFYSIHKMLKFIFVLKVAKPYIPSQMYLCHAIDRAAAADKCDPVDAHNLKNHISLMLAGNQSVISWLRINNREVYASLESYSAYREAWVDHMIAYFESEIKQLESKS